MLVEGACTGHTHGEACVGCCTRRASEREGARRRLEKGVARAVVEAQEVVIGMLHTYREATRRSRAAKQEALDEWWTTEKARRARLRVIYGKVRRGLEAQMVQRRLEREQRLGALVDAVEGAQVAANEEERRKVVRLGGEAARTRAGGVHKLGTGRYTSDGTEAKRAAPAGWEAGDVRRVRVGGVGGGDRAPRKADGTPDRRYRADGAGGASGAGNARKAGAGSARNGHLRRGLGERRVCRCRRPH